MGRSIPGRSDSIGTTPAPGGPRAGPVTCTFGRRLSSAKLGILNRREVGRGWDASETDARQGSPGVVRTPTAAAVCPLPGFRGETPGRRLIPDGRRRARRGRVSAMATITARAGPRTKATSPLSPGGPRRRDPPVPQPRLGADRRDGPLAQAAAEQRAAPARDRRPATRRSSRRPRSWTTCRRSPAERRPRRQSRRPPG